MKKNSTTLFFLHSSVIDCLSTCSSLQWLYLSSFKSDGEFFLKPHGRITYCPRVLLRKRRVFTGVKWKTRINVHVCIIRDVGSLWTGDGILATLRNTIRTVSCSVIYKSCTSPKGHDEIILIKIDMTRIKKISPDLTFYTFCDASKALRTRCKLSIYLLLLINARSGYQ